MALKKRKKHYVNNADMWQALKDYNELCDKAVAEGKEVPRIPTYLGICIEKIATNSSRRPNFIGYSYRDEMIMDGIITCIKYIRTFKCDRGNNPFAFFSQVCHNAFINRIKLEKRESYVKNHVFELTAVELQVNGEHAEYASSLKNQQDTEKLEALNKLFETKKSKKKEPEHSLDIFANSDED